MGALGAVGVGVVAGGVGTAAMTLSQRLEAGITNRADSTVPAQVGEKVASVSLETESRVRRVGLTVHWAHGVTMGAVRGLLSLTPLAPLPASLVHFPVVWGGDAALYKALGIAPSPWDWGKRELATDLFHKAVLSAMTSVVFIALSRR